MYNKLPPLQTLAAFEAAARLQSFSKAADELCLTQSAISHRIRLLESTLQVALFHRLNRQVVLTAPGHALLGTVRDVLRMLQEAVPRVANPERRLVRLTCAPALAHAWLIQRLEAFHRAHPTIDVEIHASSVNVDLRHGEFDVGLRWGTPPWPGADAHALFDEELFPVASPAYLRANGPWSTAQALMRARLLRCRRLPWRPWLDAAGLTGEEPSTGPLFNEVDLVLRAAESGQGVALLQSSIAGPSIARGALVQACDPRVPARHRYHVLHTAEAARRAEVSSLVDWLREAAARQAPPVKVAA